ncbi:MAG: hypothetical protein ACHREM_13940, partial [Polyangiales bacterium]
MRGASRWVCAVFASVVGCGGSSTSVGDAADSGNDTSSHVDADTGVSEVAIAETSADATSPTDAPTDAPTESDVAVDGAIAPTLESPGPCAVTKVDSTVAGNAVHVLVPGCAAPASGFPAVVFAHGFQLKTTDYDNLLGHLASYGFLVASVDYPGTLLSIDQRDVGKAIVAGKAALVAGAIAGVPKVDPNKIVASGHSLGGKGSFLAVLSDATFAAGLAFDPVDGNPGNPLSGGTPDSAHPQLTPTTVAPLSLPCGIFGTALSHCSTGGLGSSACAPTNEDAYAFAAALTSSKHFLWPIADFGHMQFLDDPSCGFTCSVCVAGSSPTDPHLKAVEAIAVA